MNNRVDKPMRSPAELIAMLRDEKGITFNYMTPTEAETYLNDRNNYLRTASYRKNYEKHTTGENVGNTSNSILHILLSYQSWICISGSACSKCASTSNMR